MGVNETRPLMTSQEKVRWFVDAQIAQAAQGRDMLARVAMQWVPQLLAKLPEDPEILDQQLALYAQLLLELRSDTADRLAIVEARLVAGTTTPAPPTDSTAEEIST